MWGSGAMLLWVVFTVVLAELVRRRVGRSRRLPPGSMGWPFIGDTRKFFSQHPDQFFAAKQKMYGDIVKTRILGYSTVLMASAEAVKLVLVTRPEIFRPIFPASKQTLIGRHFVSFQHGEEHKRLRHVLQSFFTPKVMEGTESRIEELVLDNLNSMDGRDVKTFYEIKRFTFNVGIMLCLGACESIDLEDLREMYQTVENGYNSYPINFPGFLFNKSLKARRKVSAIVSKLMAQREASSAAGEDILGVLMEQNFSAEEVGDNVVGVIFASQDTTASVLTWMIKYLSMNPSVLADVEIASLEVALGVQDPNKIRIDSVAEQERVRSAKSSHLDGLDWADTKKMPITSRVLQETMRLASVISYTFRAATEDVDYGGYLIPKGWKVMPLFRNIHQNAEHFSDPLMFDPSRFEKPLKPNTFLPFGIGIHQCLGSELARVNILTFIHHLVLKYRWELLDPNDDIQYRPFLIPKDGLPMHITRIES